DLAALQEAAGSEAVCRRLGKVQVLVERIAGELNKSPQLSAEPAPSVPAPVKESYLKVAAASSTTARVSAPPIQERAS
ncbi:hypothetical protein, partial [Methylobacterium haplocladii]